MKKLLCIVLAMLCLLTVGCAAEPDAPETNTPSSSDTTTTTTAPIPTGPNFISEDAALQIACQHWNFTPGDNVSVGKGDPDDAQGVGDVRIDQTPTENAPYYKATYCWLVKGADDASHWSVLDSIWIDAVTGEVTTEPLA